MANAKSLEDLAKEVIDTQKGIGSLEDLNALFANPPAPTPAPQIIAQQVVEPTPAPTAVAPTAAALTAEPPMGQPLSLDNVPEKFRGKDVQDSVNKMAKSYAELEAELKRERDERSNMQKIVDSLSAPKLPSPAPSQAPQTLDDIDDAAFFEKPKEMVMKIAERMAQQKIFQYHADVERGRYIEGFRAQHPDFDTMRQEIMEVLTARPDLDKDQRNLPIVYEMARNLKARKLADLRASLGLSTFVPPQTPAPSAAPVIPDTPVDRNKMKEEILEAIRTELLKRKNAAGIQGGSVPVNPSDRLNTAPLTKPMTVEDQILADMMSSGPRKLAIELT